MFKKLYEVAYALLSLGLLLAFGISVANAQNAHPHTAYSFFIPYMFNERPAGYSIHGRVVNHQNVPMVGVTIHTDKGQSVVTGQNGEYILTGLTEGTYTLTPSLGSMSFLPTSSAVKVPSDAVMLNFTARGLCSEAIVNSDLSYTPYNRRFACSSGEFAR